MLISSELSYAGIFENPFVTWMRILDLVTRTGQLFLFPTKISGPIAVIFLYYYTTFMHPPGASLPQSRYFSNGNFRRKTLTNPKNNTTYEKLLEFEGKRLSYYSHFHTIIWSNNHMKFDFRGYFLQNQAFDTLKVMLEQKYLLC